MLRIAGTSLDARLITFSRIHVPAVDATAESTAARSATSIWLSVYCLVCRVEYE